MSLVSFVCYRVLSIALFWCVMKTLGIGVLLLLLHLGKEGAQQALSQRS
ncbi:MULTISPECIES: hypothetical protein [Chromobacterium]|uniref:Uncharacterized protein n=1 Tax=Chromobacterium aquaticum TaxID=467180 RepID=A0ABV8ZTE1_9NEIS|nr:MULTISPECIES: hypothetical protein [Chromobacterium]MCD5363021.1 hypothetical protein [Chromobacterium aquaticum]